VVQEHEINSRQRAFLVQPTQRGVAGADYDLDNVAEAGEVNERGDDGCELGVALETPVSPADFADGRTEEQSRVPDIAS
jgi:hypothetical protein